MPLETLLIPVLCIGPLAHAQEVEESVITEIVVTATRKSEPLSRVPISVAAFTTETMEKFNVKQVDDLVRLTPGLSVGRSVTGANTISIRGISSAAGAGVTGVYIDDTPIQVRNVGYGSGTAFPEIFDLERVEVLRGPQGTLFGAGSEGGTVRFIQSKPDMTEYSAYVRGEMAQTDNGDSTYEGGLALGGPLIADRLGFRGNVYYRREGGYVDGVVGIAQPAVDPNNPGSSPAAEFPNGNLIDFTRTATVRKDTNWSEALAARLAVEFMPIDGLSITPSISYQKLHTNDGGGSFWTSTSDISDRDYSRVVYTRGDPATNSALSPVDLSDKDEGDDRFYLPALAVNVDLGAVELISNTSYFDRSSSRWWDFTRIDAVQFAGQLFPDRGMKSASLYEVEQQSLVQEVRLQSADTDTRLRWIVGAFYSRNKQNTDQAVISNFIENLPFVFGVPANGDPFGPGASAVTNALGVPLLPNSASYSEARRLTETQYAAFGQLDFRLIEDLTLTAGLRASRNDLTFTGIFRGPLNNDNPPFGSPCPAGETCVPGGAGTFAPIYQDTIGFKKAETSVTPKLGISYQATSNDMVYATASKGFRPAGVMPRVPAIFCGPDLATTGYVNADGSSAQPVTFDSDSVWSYEIGSKNRLANGRLSIDASVYYIDWSDIQTQVLLPTCLYDFVDNLGSASSEGFDLALQAEPIDGLTLGATVGYNDAHFTENVVTPGGVLLYRKGAPIEASRPWTTTVSAQYDWSNYYARADFSYFDEARRAGATDRRSPVFNRELKPDEAYSVLNARLGLRYGDADISLFVDNVTNEAPIFGMAREIGGFVYTADTLRPRTAGVSVSFRR